MFVGWLNFTGDYNNIYILKDYNNLHLQYYIFLNIYYYSGKYLIVED